MVPFYPPKTPPILIVITLSSPYPWMGKQIELQLLPRELHLHASEAQVDAKQFFCFHLSRCNMASISTTLQKHRKTQFHHIRNSFGLLDTLN